MLPERRIPYDLSAKHPDHRSRRLRHRRHPFSAFFAVSRQKGTAPFFIRYLGKVLPYAVMGLLVVYSLKDVTILAGNHGVPEAIALLFLVILHLWKKNMLLSIAGGTMLYMILIQTVFG